MNTINAILTVVTDRLISPIAGWPPLLLLLLVSALAGVLMAVVFRFTSRQQALKRVVELSRAQMLAIKLFKDDLGTMFHSLGQLLRYNGMRLWYSLPPMVVMIIPFVLLMSQLARWYENYPLGPGDQAVVELQLAANAWPQYRNIVLHAPPQIAVETRPLRDDNKHTIYWRIRAVQPTPAPIRWRFGAEQVQKKMALGTDREALCAVSARRPGPGWWDRLLYPGEPGLAATDPVQGIVVHHLHRTTPVFGLNVPWWLTFVIVSILSAVLVRPLVKVNF